MAVDKSIWPPNMGSYTEPLAALALRLKPKTILEIGMGYEGFSTNMWLEHCDAKLTSIDKKDWQNTAPKIKAEYPDRFTFIEGRSEEVMPTLKGKYDLIFIDGLHSYEGCKADILNAIPLLKKGGVMLIDDYGVKTSALDVEDWKVIEGDYGVQEATDECLKGWTQVYTDINFGNGARAYVSPQSGKR